jgi:hypothetical protein
MLYGVPLLKYDVMVKKIHEKLEELDKILIKIAVQAPGKPLVSEDMVKLFKQAGKVATDLYDKLHGAFPYRRVLEQLIFTVDYLDDFIRSLRDICEKVWIGGTVMRPDPCDIHTLDSHVGSIKRDFAELEKYKAYTSLLDLRDRRFKVEEMIESLLSRLSDLNTVCKETFDLNCLKYVGSEGVISASLRSYVLDLASATRLVDYNFTRLYGFLEEYRVGHVRLYEHPASPRELSDLAEYMANILHKQVEVGMAPKRLKGKIQVLSLKDRVEALIHDIGYIIARPSWIVEIHQEGSGNEALILAHILAKRGFRVELVHKFVGEAFRITIPPESVREAVKIACMLSAVPAVETVGWEKVFNATLSSIELLESKLREQEPLKKRKVGL